MKYGTRSHFKQRNYFCSEIVTGPVIVMSKDKVKQGHPSPAIHQPVVAQK